MTIPKMIANFFMFTFFHSEPSGEEPRMSFSIAQDDNQDNAPLFLVVPFSSSSRARSRRVCHQSAPRGGTAHASCRDSGS